MQGENRVSMKFSAKSVNEGFARMAVTAFMAEMNPTLDEMEDVKTAVSEAVTNAIIHGYQEDESKQVDMLCKREQNKLTIIIEDFGVGIEDVETAKQPFYTTRGEEERSGMGFAFMEAFMDEMEVISKLGEGTRIIMAKYIEREHGR
uniref:anti-sigma F factor n=1 Tax=Agathobacter sp. TaxID=2021311 RepID=UPI004056BDA1